MPALLLPPPLPPLLPLALRSAATGTQLVPAEGHKAGLQAPLLPRPCLPHPSHLPPPLTALPFLCRYVFPKGHKEWRSRVGVALGLLMGSKLLNVQVGGWAGGFRLRERG